MKKKLIKHYEYLRKHLLFLKRRFVAPKLPTNTHGRVLINVGCGLDSNNEFINIDVLPFPNIHYIQDITDLSNFEDNYADMIYASHVVEHIPRAKLQSTILEWKRVLKRGGVFRFSVPDFNSLVDIYIASGRDVDVVRDNVLGQDPPYNNHYTLWNFDKAQKFLTELGFSEIKLWDHGTASHHDFKDRSSRVLKAGDTERLLSLNIEAIKS